MEIFILETDAIINGAIKSRNISIGNLSFETFTRYVENTVGYIIQDTFNYVFYVSGSISYSNASVSTAYIGVGFTDKSVGSSMNTSSNSSDINLAHTSGYATSGYGSFGVTTISESTYKKKFCIYVFDSNSRPRDNVQIYGVNLNLNVCYI